MCWAALTGGVGKESYGKALTAGCCLFEGIYHPKCVFGTTVLVESEQVKLGWERSVRMPGIDSEGDDTGFQHQPSWGRAAIPHVLGGS